MIKRSLDQITNKAKSFLLGVQFFLEANKRMDGKPMCFHLNEVSCFNKGEKAGKSLQFGRAFQLGRIGGNFLICFPSSDVRMEDKHNVKNVISFHQKLFGVDVLRSAGLDKGYFSNANQKFLKSIPNLKEICLQKPGLDISKLEESQKDLYTRLADRRSGTEPLIGHAKHGGQLGKSRMKKDSTSLAAGKEEDFSDDLTNRKKLDTTADGDGIKKKITRICGLPSTQVFRVKRQRRILC